MTTVAQEAQRIGTFTNRSEFRLKFSVKKIVKMSIFLRLFFKLIEIDGVFFGKRSDISLGKLRIHPPTDALRKPSVLEKKL